jgi:hypothetical protein
MMMMRSKTRESTKGTTTISIDTRKANVEKNNESDLRYVADQDWEHVISGHGLVGRCPSRVIRHNHKRLIQRSVAGGTRRQCPKASRRLHRNCFFFFSLSLSPSSSSSLTAGRASTMSRSCSSSSNRRII